jgi:hypothetical protein
VQPDAQNPRITFSYPAKTTSQKSPVIFCFGYGGSAAHKRLLGPWGYLYYQAQPTTVIFFLRRFILRTDRLELTLSLSLSIVAPLSLKQILDSNHQNLREKAAKLD